MPRTYSNQSVRHAVRGEEQKLGARHLLPHDYAAPKVKSNQVKTRLAKIHAERCRSMGYFLRSPFITSCEIKAADHLMN
jgi:hypothetical protein